MICIQKIYGFHGLNPQTIDNYVTPVTDGRRKVENRAVLWWTRNRNIESPVTRTMRKDVKNKMVDVDINLNWSTGMQPDFSKIPCLCWNSDVASH